MNWEFFIVAELLVLGVSTAVVFLAFDALKSAKESGKRDLTEKPLADTPPFFSRARPRQPSRRMNADDLAVSRLEQYLKEEQVEAAEFVARPSVATLYRNSQRYLTLS